MVNLRYHVVTLVAVFLALAVGVVLGAGPLQNRINTASDGSNAVEHAAQLEADLELAQGLAEQQGQFIDAVAKEIVPGTLSNKAVVLVALPGSSADEAKAISDLVKESGGSVVGTVRLTAAWTSVGQREYRDTLSAPISSHLANPAVDASADDILGQALTDVLTKTGSEVDIMREILSDATLPLVEGDSWPTTPAKAIILVGKASTEEDSTSLDKAQSGGQEDQSLVSLALAAAAAPGGAVAVGSADSPADFIALLREASAPIATVDQGGTAMARLNVVLALASGQTGAFGLQDGATAPVAPMSR